MGDPEIMAAWDEMCLKCVAYDAMTAAGVVVGDDGAVRWHGLTGEQVEGMQGAVKGMVGRLRLAEAVCHAVGSYQMANTQTVPYVEPRMLDAYAAWREYVHREPTLAAAAGRGADGEATQ